jgi:hypothetical protein
MNWNDCGSRKTLVIAERPAIVVAGVAAALCLAVLTGCGGAKVPPRVALEGTVTLDGKPLADGNIRLLPAADTDGGMIGAKIADGRFAFPAERGASPGKYRVEIGASRPTGRKVPDPRREEPVDEFVQYLPDRYNSQSTLTAEVTATGPNRFEFALSSR